MSASRGRAIAAGGLRPNAAALDSRALTRELGRASTLAELLSLEQRHGDRFDHFNLGAFWSKFKKLPRGELGGLRDHLAPVCQQSVRMLPTLSAREVANLSHAFAGLVGSGPWESVWAFATAGHASAELFNAISAEVVRRRLGNFNPQDLSITAWSFAKAGHESEELFNAISAEVVRRRLGTFKPQALSNTAWAFATAGHESVELFNAISAEVVRRRLGGFEAQALANLAWAFAVFNPFSADEVFGTTIFSTRCIQLETTFSRLELSQLHQWSIWREERSAQWPGLPNSLRQACRTAFDAQGETSSLLQHKVVQEIRSCGFRVKDEHRCKSSGYSIDALITLNNGEQIAVEVDGPCHFVGRSHQKSGSTLLKHHQLRYFGWRLRSVPYWEWDADGCKALHWLPRGH